jgi:hypothetical protein
MVSELCKDFESDGKYLIHSRPSLFDDFVEYELDRLKKLELSEQAEATSEDDTNNNIKSSMHEDQLTLQAN